MSDVLNPVKVKALELAAQQGGTPDEVVKRSHVYHGFLTSAAAPAGAATGGKPAGDKPAATTTKAPAADAAAVAAAAVADAAAKAAKAADATKAANAAKAAAAAAKPPKATAEAKAAGVTGAPIAPDTKAPGGAHSYADVVAKLREVQNDPDLGRDKAVAIMQSVGGVKSVRDMKPAKYDSVVTACTNALNGEGDNGAEGEIDALGGDLDDPTASAPRDEAGL